MNKVFLNFIEELDLASNVDKYERDGQSIQLYIKRVSFPRRASVTANFRILDFSKS